MLARAAGSGSRLKRAVLPYGNGRRLSGVPVSKRLVGEILHHAKPDSVVQFVHASVVVRTLAGRPAFQNNHGKRCASGDFFGHQEAGPAASGDHDVNGFQTLHDCQQYHCAAVI